MSSVGDYEFVLGRPSHILKYLFMLWSLYFVDGIVWTYHAHAHNRMPIKCNVVALHVDYLELNTMKHIYSQLLHIV